MSGEVYRQLYVFFRLLLLGSVIGLIYDFLIIFLFGLKKRVYGELVFIVFTFFATASVLYYYAEYEMRLFFFLGLLSGWLIYFFSLSKVLRFYLTKAQDAKTIFFAKTMNVTKKTFTFISAPVTATAEKIKKYGKKIKKTLNSIYSLYNKYTKK